MADQINDCQGEGRQAHDVHGDQIRRARAFLNKHSVTTKGD